MLMKQVTNPTQQEMIKKIYEEMADETLEEWCLIRYFGSGKYQKEYVWIYLWDSSAYCDIQWEYEASSEKRIIFVEPDSLWIIWHPLRIWDVLDWIRIYTKTSEKYFYQEKMILSIWKDKRNPIPLEWWEEREELVTYLYSLIR